LANGIMVLGLYGLAFIGGWMEQIGTLLGNGTARYLGIAASLIVPSEALWLLAAHNMQPLVTRDLNLTPFSPASVPSPAMVAGATSCSCSPSPSDSSGPGICSFRPQNRHSNH